MEQGSAAVPPVGDGFKSLSEQVYDALLQAIVERRIKPGERLVLDDLAAQLRVSRTPIRDALSRLAAEGLVQPHGRRGFAVTTLSAADIENLYDLRLMCETYAVEKGIDRLTPELLARVESLAAEVARLIGSGRSRDRLNASFRDAELHRQIISLAGNPRLSDLFELLNTHVQTLRAGPSPATPREIQAFAILEHTQIIDALRERDREAAKAAVAFHLDAARSRALAALRLEQMAAERAAVGEE